MSSVEICRQWIRQIETTHMIELELGTIGVLTATSLLAFGVESRYLFQLLHNKHHVP
jgi:hypothetical protein